MFKKIQYRIVFYVALASLFPLLLKTLWDYQQSRRSIEKQVFEQLISIREINKQRLEDYFARLQEQTTFFAQRNILLDAAEHFQKAFDQISHLDTSAAMKPQIKAFYEQNYFPKLKDFLAPNEQKDLLPVDHKATFLQYYYNVSQDSTPHAYHSAYQKFDGQLVDFAKTFGYKDIFLIDPNSGYVIYSTEKGYELGTNLLIGAYANTNLARLFRELREIPKTKVRFTDYEFYMPNLMQPAFFLGTNLVKNGKILATLIIEIPVSRINDLMTYKNQWKQVGLGKTGEVYLVGSDFLLRNESRFWVENPKEFLQTSPLPQQAYLKKHNTSILGISVKNPSITQALQHQQGIHIIKDYREVEVLSAYTPVEAMGLTWALVAEMDKTEALQELDELLERSLLTFLLIFIILLAVLLLIARQISKPIQDLVAMSQQISSGNYKVELKNFGQDELGILAKNFNQMALNIFTNVQNLNQQTQELNSQNEELEIQRDLLEKQAQFLEESNQRMSETQKMLHEQRQFMQLIADQTPALILVKDQQGHYTFANQATAKLLGLTPQELLNKDSIEDDFFLDNQDIQEVIREKKASYKERELLLKGEKSYFMFSKIPITHNQQTECLIVAVDISPIRKAEITLQQKVQALEVTEEELRQNNEELHSVNEHLKKVQEQMQKLLERERRGREVVEKAYEKMKNTQAQLIESEKMASLGQLVAGIAHEINNPLNFIMGGIQSLELIQNDLFELIEAYEEFIAQQDKESLPKSLLRLRKNLSFEECKSDMEALAQDIIKGAVRATEIVKSLRIFSRMDTDEARHADLHQLLDSTLVILKNQYKHRITVERVYDANLPQISCYPGKLSQVFMNLIANAIQAIEGEGKITIQTGHLDDKKVFIRISDTGGGIPEKILNRIFEPFFTTKDVGKGTGLGLSISHGIIQKHKGKISVESKLGEGTTFQIVLPNEI